MPKPYSDDLREHVIEALEAGASRREAAESFNLCPSSAVKYDWVLEFDIKGLFDNLPHDLLLKAVRNWKSWRRKSTAATVAAR